MVDYTVYLVTDAPEHYRRGLLDEVAAAIEGGVSIVQYRDISPAKRGLYETARALRALTRARGVPLLINDHLDLALAVEADGAHVGQSDLPVEAARRVLGPGKLLGLSVTSLAEFEAADLACLDYLGVGPIFPTGSKADAAPATGLPLLAEIAARSTRPVVAIGGITIERAPAVFASGAAGVAVIAALSQTNDPTAAARALRAAAGR
jgi:thiamine-phosphate pyrophosphorylase